MAQVPSIGRIVHYVTPTLVNGVPFAHVGQHRPAIIVHVWGDGPDALLQLQVFADGNGSPYNDGAPNVVWATSVIHDEVDKAPGTWHWPEFTPPQP